jgi:hypothetical protein
MFVSSTSPVELRYAAEWRPFPSDAVESTQRTQFRLSPWQIIAIIAGLLVVIVGSLLYIGSLRSGPASIATQTGTTAQPTVAAPTAGTTAAPPPTAVATSSGSLPAPVGGSVGSQLRVAGLRLTVVSVTTSVSPTHPTPALRSGNRFYLVEVLYENASGRPAFVSPFDWALTDQAGRVYEVVQPGLSNDLTDRQLPSGGEARGVIGFDVPSSATGLTVHYASEQGDEEAAVPVG